VRVAPDGGVWAETKAGAKSTRQMAMVSPDAFNSNL